MEGKQGNSVGMCVKSVCHVEGWQVRKDSKTWDEEIKLLLKEKCIGSTYKEDVQITGKYTKERDKGQDKGARVKKMVKERGYDPGSVLMGK